MLYGNYVKRGMIKLDATLEELDINDVGELLPQEKMLPFLISSPRVPGYIIPPPLSAATPNVPNTNGGPLLRAPGSSITTEISMSPVRFYVVDSPGRTLSP